MHCTTIPALPGRQIWIIRFRREAVKEEIALFLIDTFRFLPYIKTVTIAHPLSPFSPNKEKEY
jgi:hypothetical protein